MKYFVLTLLLVCFAFNIVHTQTHKDTAPQAYNTLLIPDTISGTTFNITAAASTKQFLAGQATNTTGYNGNYFGPTLIFKQGDTVHMNVTNHLIDTTTVHWHGMHLPGMMDGGPHQAIAPNTLWQPYWYVSNFAATYWYHPHLHTTTERQVTSGMTGFIIVRDAHESSLNLPRKYGVDDFPLALADRRFSQTNQFVIGPYGDTMLVNGTLNPVLSVPSQVVRFRLLDASGQRSYNIGFSDNRTFYVITTDGGLLNAPVAVTRYLISVGERVEILANFSGQQGQSFDLMAYNASLTPGIPGFEPVNDPGPAANALGHRDFNLLHLTVTAQTGTPVTTIPNTLTTNILLNEDSVDVTRNLLISDTTVAGHVLHMFNHKLFDHMRNDYTVVKNDIEIWQIVNTSPISHPFHIHDIEFNVLTRNGQPAAAIEQGWKDVILVKPNETVRFIGQFSDYADPDMPYMFHCHILKHEDDGLMGQFIVVDSLPAVVPMYRTFSTSILLGDKTNSLKPKKNQPAKLPNTGNWRDTTVFRSGGKSGITIGLPQTSGILAKTVGWVRWKTGATVKKMYATMQTDTAYNAPLDSIRKSGVKKKKLLVKEFTPSSSSYTNPLLQSAAVFKLNLLSSQHGITPMGLDSLMYMNPASPFDGFTLGQISNKIDSIMTFWKTQTLPGGAFPIVGSTQLENLRKMLNTINDAFDTTIALANGDSIVTGEGLKFAGLIPLSAVSFLEKGMDGKYEQILNFAETSSEPERITLQQNYPNPFNPTTAISFSLLAVSNVSLKVYNVLGQEVATLVNNQLLEAGEHHVEFNAGNLSSGVYYYRLAVTNSHSGQVVNGVKKMVLMR